MKLRRIVLIRHGETEGESSVRFHGATDVPLSAEGRAQMRKARTEVGEPFPDVVVASPLRRSWQAARVVADGAPVRLDPDFREIDFGRWEGLTKEQIQARDPVLYEDWQARAPGFEFPGGEAREDFLDRVQRGLDRLASGGERSALLVIHKGVIRAIVHLLTGDDLPPDAPPLGATLTLTRRPDATWHPGRRSTNP